MNRIILSAAIALGGIAGNENPKIAEAKKDANGFLIHAVQSDLQKSKTEIQVLLPDRLEKDRRYPVIYVLPVERGTDSVYGHGLLEVKKLNLHNKHRALFVLPTFTDWPWFMDTPADRQETYFLTVVLPFVEKQYPASKRRLLLGFSKSGWGAVYQLARHPDLFAKAAVFDAPFNEFGLTNDRFKMDKRIAGPLRQHAEEFRKEKRLALLGYASFSRHQQGIHGLLEQLKIPHEYRDQRKPKHSWDAGWIEEGVRFLTS